MIADVSDRQGEALAREGVAIYSVRVRSEITELAGLESLQYQLESPRAYASAP